MKPKLLYAVPAQWFDKVFREAVRTRIAEWCDVIEAPVPKKPDADFILKYVGEARILITSWDTARVDADILAAARNLEFVAHAAGSVKPVMSEAAWERGIRAAGILARDKHPLRPGLRNLSAKRRDHRGELCG